MIETITAILLGFTGSLTLLTSGVFIGFMAEDKDLSFVSLISL